MASDKSAPRIVVIGAGVGGLTTASVLARAGLDVTVLEAHIYAGGCAGTFYHQGYRFDAGATMPAGFYPGGPMDLVGQAAGIGQWPVRPSSPAMVVHLPDGSSVTRHTGDARWRERQEAFGREAERFWHWQEETSDALWDLALRMPPWPPQTPAEIAQLMGTGATWLTSNIGRHLRPRLAMDALRPVGYHLRGASERLRLFVDAQLLIASQATSRTTNALYGTSALDLPRRGVAHAEGGMGAIAAALVGAVRNHGGQVHFRQAATRIVLERGRPIAVETNKKASFPADLVVVNLPPWNVAPMLGDQAPHRLRTLPPAPRGVWGAFMVYAGLDGSLIPGGFPLHHQVVVGEPLGNGNSIFMSLSPEWDETRAAPGRRTLTLSTHTDLDMWWELNKHDRQAYEELKDEYTNRTLAAAGRVLPGLREAADLLLPATPITFQRFTRRASGWVGGFPQTSLLQAWGPRLAPGIWMVGDSIFPGQSVPAVALGGMRVVRTILKELGIYDRMPNDTVN